MLSGSEIIYLGWIMAGGIKGYKEAAKLYKVRAVCGIGMGQTGTQLKEVRDKNAIPQRIPLFTLQGNFDVKKLHGAYRFMMNVMVKTVGKGLANKTARQTALDFYGPIFLLYSIYDGVEDKSYVIKLLEEHMDHFLLEMQIS